MPTVVFSVSRKIPTDWVDLSVIELARSASSSSSRSNTLRGPSTTPLVILMLPDPPMRTCSTPPVTIPIVEAAGKYIPVLISVHLLKAAWVTDPASAWYALARISTKPSGAIVTLSPGLSVKETAKWLSLRSIPINTLVWLPRLSNMPESAGGGIFCAKLAAKVTIASDIAVEPTPRSTWAPTTIKFPNIVTFWLKVLLVVNTVAPSVIAETLVCTLLILAYKRV